MKEVFDISCLKENIDCGVLTTSTLVNTLVRDYDFVCDGVDSLKNCSLGGYRIVGGVIDTVDYTIQLEFI